MYTKKYQVFVSSTFNDLKEERNAVLMRLLLDGFIPAGMELFGAVDEDIFNHIKRIIDVSDYYVVIVGNRYGATDAEGVSYTEKEYLYAKEKKIPVLALIHSDPGTLQGKHVENAKLKKKLEAFRKSLKTGRLVDFWTDKATLVQNAMSALHKEANLFPGTGWVRADAAGSVETIAELNTALKKVETLEAKVATLEAVPAYQDLAGLDDPVVVAGTYSLASQERTWAVTATWRFVAEVVTGRVLSAQWDHILRSALTKVFFDKSGVFNHRSVSIYAMSDDSFERIGAQLRAYKLITITPQTGGCGWQTTNAGEKFFYDSRVTRTTDTSNP